MPRTLTCTGRGGANPDGVSGLAHAERRRPTLTPTVAAQGHAAHLIGQVLRWGRGLMGHAAVGRRSVSSSRRSRRWSRVAAQGEKPTERVRAERTATVVWINLLIPAVTSGDRCAAGSG